jgi:thiamine biosynthesis lipoprotein
MQNSPNPDEQTYLLDISRRAMACQFQILLNADEQHSAAETAVQALDLVEDIEEQLSIFRTESQITRVNRLAAETPQSVSPDVFQLLTLAKQIWKQTDGAFDITSTPLSKVWGFHTRQSTLPLPDDITSAKQTVGCQFLQLINNTVSFDHPQLEINLGGIGKGYALDSCRQHFSSQLIENYLLHAGHSSILAHGNRKNLTAKNRGWQIALRHPLIPQRQLANIWLRDRAIGTSGDANQFFYHQGKRYGHVIDPRSGWPTQDTLSATVITHSAAAADALATAFFVIGPEKATRYCQQNPDTAFIIATPGDHHRVIQLHIFGVEKEDLEVTANNVELIEY